MSDLRPHVLRWRDNVRGEENVFCTKGFRFVAAIRMGDAERYTVDFDAIAYGRNVPKVKRAFCLSRLSENVWTLESCILHQNLPRSAYLLINVPGEVGDSWARGRQE